MSINGEGFARQSRQIEHDDIERLRESIHMPGFPYVDFSAQKRYLKAIARWPLLRELAAKGDHEASP